VKRQYLVAGQRFSRHRHPYAYAAVVLEGAYCEAGSGGRFRVKSGEVVFHDAFEAHLNCVEREGAVILNIPMQPQDAEHAHFAVADVDAIAAAAERDPFAAARMLLESLDELPAQHNDWPDLLAFDLRRNAVPSLADWSRSYGLTPHSLSRGFRAAFGVSPKRFGLESKVAAAWRRISASCESLSAIAADSGFSDQAHMTRAISEITGNSPSRWRVGADSCIPSFPDAHV
jgi:AraC-like DNA-binding protein